ncbi:MAG: ABC transporter permease, partial [Chloroflexota bacterium]
IILFSHLPRLAGWSFAEIAFFYGSANIAFATSDMLVGHLDQFPATIRDGTFDLRLIRPAGSLFQVIASDLQLRRLGRVLQGVVVMIYAVWNVGIDWTAPKALMVPVMLVTGTVIYSSIWIAAITVTFFTVEARELANSFTYGGSFLASYPINIFGGWTRRFLAFVVPMAFVSYFPGLYILGHADPLHAPRFLQFSAPLVALITVLVAFRIWQFGVHHYQSTGS